MLFMHANYLRMPSATHSNRRVCWDRHQQIFFTHPHFATASQKHRNPRFPPYAFTEHGAIMAAMVLNSPRAVEMSVYVVRAFVQLRELLSSNRELARRLAQLEARLDKKLTEHDEAIAAILSAIRELMNPPGPTPRPIGFTADLGE
jgi:phage regulator Rha-like protein